MLRFLMKFVEVHGKEKITNVVDTVSKPTFYALICVPIDYNMIPYGRII